MEDLMPSKGVIAETQISRNHLKNLVPIARVSLEKIFPGGDEF
jgi:hypothetical protein